VNGIHDMGGMDGMGPIHFDAPSSDGGTSPFHATWEAKAFSHLLALGALGRWNNDAVRSRLETFEAADYLRMSYFERWNAAVTRLLIETGVLNRAEVETGLVDPNARRGTPPLRAADVPAMLAKGSPYDREVSSAPRFQVGDAVRSLNPNPPGHTRLPRYARDKPGVVARSHGGYVFPDSSAQFAGERPQYLYSVRFEAQALWGTRGCVRDAVYVDIWEEHLDAR